MEIKIEDYLSDNDIKEIIQEEVKKHIKTVLGDVSVSVEKERVFISKFAKNLAKLTGTAFPIIL